MHRRKTRTLPHLWHRKNKCCHVCELSARGNSIFLNTMRYVCTFRQQPDGFLHSSNKTPMHLDEKLSLQPGSNASATTLISILPLTCNRQHNSYIKKLPNLIFVHLKSLPQMKYFVLFHVIQYCQMVWGFFLQFG